MRINFKFLQVMIAWSCFASTFANSQVHESNSINKGFEIIFNRSLGNCVTCHTIKNPNISFNIQEVQGNFAPDLSYVGDKYSRPVLTQWVTDARQMRPQTLMPPYGSLNDIVLPNQNKTLLTNEQIALVVEALLTLKNKP